MSPTEDQTRKVSARPWRARLVRFGALAVALLMILTVAALALLSALLGTDYGSRWVLERAVEQLQTEGREIRFQQSQGTLLAGLRVTQLSYREGELLITAASLHGSWNPMSLLSGEFIIDQLALDGLHVHWPSTEEASVTEQVSSDPFVDIVPLPIDINIARFTLRNADFAVEEAPYHVDSLTLSATLRGRHINLRTLRLAAPTLQVAGDIEADLISELPITATLNWQYKGDIVEGIDAASGDLHVSGNLNRLELEHTLGIPAQIVSRGTIDLNLLNDGPVADAFQFTHRIEPQLLSATSLEEDRRLRIESAQISTEGTLSSVAFSGDARITVEDAEGAAVAPTLDWHWRTQWQGTTLTVETLELASATGNIETSGNIGWQDGVQLNLHLSVQERDGGLYQALLPEGLIIGALQGSGDLSILQSEDRLEGELSINSLTGELNAYPLNAAGTLHYGAEGLLIEDLHVASGSTTLAVNGKWSDSVDLHWEIDAADIGTLSPLLSGGIDANGTLRGTPEAPQINFEASGDQLDFAGTQVNRLRANGIYLNNRNMVQIEIEGLEMSPENSQRIDSISIAAQGTPAEHTLTIALRSPLGEANLRTAGTLDYAAPMQWTGRLLEGRVLSDLGLWQLEDESSLVVSAESLTLASQCWRQAQSALCVKANWIDSGELNATASLSDYPLTHFNASAQGARQNPEGALLPQLPAGSRAEGSLDAQLSAVGILTDEPGDLTLRFDIDAGEGMIHIDPAEPGVETLAELEAEAAVEQTFYWRNASLSGSRIDALWQISSTLDFYQPNLANSGMSVQGSANAELSLTENQELDGRLNLAFDDLSWVEAFLPSLQNTQGQLEGQIHLFGSLETPGFEGNVSLREASFDVPGLGMELRDIETSLTSDNDQTLRISGRASSGEGSLQFDSMITSAMSPDRQYDISINGDNFTLASDEEILLKISPDLTVTGTDRSLNITGSLLLPVVDVQLTELPESAIDVSADTVIVANNPDTPVVHNAAQVNRGILDDFSLTAEVSIKLGDEARFRGFGLDAGLSGALDITQRETGSPLSYGELSIVDGYYETYGRRLDIEHGKLLFFGSLENPALDIRAVRQTEDVKAGVQMNGTLRNIRSQLFSTPTLPDSDIMAVLITGRPFAEMGNQDSNALAGAITSLGINQGKSFTNQVRTQLGLDTLAINSTGDTSNSSLTLGKYLTPKIFIRYGVGLFETESTLSVDYSVSDRIKLEAKSGSSQSVDIKYTVER